MVTIRNYPFATFGGDIEVDVDDVVAGLTTVNNTVYGLQGSQYKDFTDVYQGIQNVYSTVIDIKTNLAAVSGTPGGAVPSKTIQIGLKDTDGNVQSINGYTDGIIKALNDDFVNALRNVRVSSVTPTPFKSFVITPLTGAGSSTEESVEYYLHHNFQIILTGVAGQQAVFRIEGSNVSAVPAATEWYNLDDDDVDTTLVIPTAATVKNLTISIENYPCRWVRITLVSITATSLGCAYLGARV